MNKAVSDYAMAKEIAQLKADKAELLQALQSLYHIVPNPGQIREKQLTPNYARLWKDAIQKSECAIAKHSK